MSLSEDAREKYEEAYDRAWIDTTYGHNIFG